MIRRLLLPVAAAIIGLAGGVVLVLAFAPSAPDGLQPPAVPRTLGLTEIEFRDERSLGLTAAVDRSAPIALNTNGMVTGSGCVTGGTIRTGDVIANIDAAPVVALASSTPLFRDLVPGDEGADVIALRQALRGLGFEVDADGPYSAAVRNAVWDIQHRTGVEPADGSLRISSVAWLPAPAIVASSCEITVGERYDAGSPFAEVPGKLRSLTLVAGETTTPVPGDRTIRLGTHEFAMPERGVIEDRSTLDAVAASPEYLANAAKPKDSTLTVSTRLVAPLRVVSVPPGAVVGSAGARCLQLESGETIVVRVVASRLGTSFVTFDRDIPDRIRIGSAVTAKDCR